MARLPRFHTSPRRFMSRKYDTLNLIEVSRSAILHNFDLLESLHRTDIIPVLKSNAYGHGIREVAIVLRSRKFPYIAVDGYFEALEIRRVSKQPVLIMGSIGSNDINKLPLRGATYVIHSPESFDRLSRATRKVNVHIEINTGMNRHGLSPTELKAVLKQLPSTKLVLEGVMTHLADADNPTSDAYSIGQYQQFSHALRTVRRAGFQPRYIHATNSAGTAKDLPAGMGINAVRPGIALYGINPLEPDDPHYDVLQQLSPALQFVSHIDQVQTLRKGDRISYNGIYTCRKDTRIGVVPVGYYEGVPRALSNCGVLIGGGNVRLPIRGRVCMNHTMVDVTVPQLSVGDEVTIISSTRSQPNSIQSLADKHGLFTYSLLTGLSSSTRRVIGD
ncbi:alanine racemase [Candidatus Saccharibacteria bacterium]|nr:alanine racemase [Candidatus Saccharibacteria bacterium]